jgi:hypothetical protein
MIGCGFARASLLPLLHAIHLDLHATGAPQAQSPLHAYLRPIIKFSTTSRPARQPLDAGFIAPDRPSSYQRDDAALRGSNNTNSTWVPAQSQPLG